MRSVLYKIGISCVVGRWEECRDLGAQLSGEVLGRCRGGVSIRKYRGTKGNGKWWSRACRLESVSE